MATLLSVLDEKAFRTDRRLQSPLIWLLLGLDFAAFLGALALPLFEPQSIMHSPAGDVRFLLYYYDSKVNCTALIGLCGIFGGDGHPVGLTHPIRATCLSQTVTTKPLVNMCGHLRVLFYLQMLAAILYGIGVLCLFIAMLKWCSTCRARRRTTLEVERAKMLQICHDAGVITGVLFIGSLLVGYGSHKLLTGRLDTLMEIEVTFSYGLSGFFAWALIIYLLTFRYVIMHLILRISRRVRDAEKYIARLLGVSQAHRLRRTEMNVRSNSAPVYTDGVHPMAARLPSGVLVQQSTGDLKEMLGPLRAIAKAESGSSDLLTSHSLSFELPGTRRRSSIKGSPPLDATPKARAPDGLKPAMPPGTRLELPQGSQAPQSSKNLDVPLPSPTSNSSQPAKLPDSEVSPTPSASASAAVVSEGLATGSNLADSTEKSAAEREAVVSERQIGPETGDNVTQVQEAGEPVKTPQVGAGDGDPPSTKNIS